MNSFKSKILKIDSSQATTYLNNEKTAFRTQFQDISIENDESIVYSLISAVIPYSWYSVHKGNNVLDYSITTNNITTQHTILMAYGNYSASEYLKEFLIILNNPNIIILYHRIQNRFSFEYTLINSSMKFLFKTGPNALKSMHRFLGFELKDVDINRTTSTQCVIMNDIFYLYLKTDLGSSIIDCVDIDNVLEVIPINISPLQFIDYHPININKYLLNAKTLSDITISLQTNKHEVLDLNNIPFYITIKIDIVKNDHHDIAYSKEDPRNQININEETNLEIFSKNPNLLKQQPLESAGISMNDYLEYLNLESMLKKINKKESKLKNKRK